jgi:hypothetical protein
MAGTSEALRRYRYLDLLPSGPSTRLWGTSW